MTMHRAIFVDRDGTININRPDHVKTWDEFVFLPNALSALRKLAARDWLVIVTTNQAAIARGQTQEETVRDIHARMTQAVASAGGRIDAVYFCPHHPDEQCDCRKPRTGLYVQAARQFDIDLSQSIVIGDAVADIEAAQAIGAIPILVLTGRGPDAHAQLSNNHSGYTTSADLLDAVEWIEHKEGLA
jgi:D-glycero-D-manno-heptose 1,7-bisphosphate phosphatase